MTVTEFIEVAPAEKQAVLKAIHQVILANDATVQPVIKPMMGIEMILYEERGYMKYGLASTKNYFSLHCLPMYMNKPMHSKYEGLLPAVKFQKGCINFADTVTMPPSVVGQLIADCSSISIADMLESRKKRK